MNANSNRESVEEVTAWLQAEANRRGLNGAFRTSPIRTEGNWLHFAVGLGNVGDSFDRARILQEMEDVWEEREPRSDWRLFLIPTSVVEPVSAGSASPTGAGNVATE